MTAQALLPFAQSQTLTYIAFSGLFGLIGGFSVVRRSMAKTRLDYAIYESWGDGWFYYRRGFINYDRAVQNIF